MSKIWRKYKTYQGRPLPEKHLRHDVYIFTTGKTECLYFDYLKSKWRLQNLKKIKIIPKSPEALPEEMDKFFSSIKTKKLIVWCVFDTDNDKEHGYRDEQIKKCTIGLKNRDIHIAHSNKCFEVWLLLHYLSNISSVWSKDDYYKKLSHFFGNEYKKLDKNNFDKLFTRLSTALNNAGKLYDKNKETDAILSDPSTSVHLLINELRRFKR